jgi:hypothetical protein
LGYGAVKLATFVVLATFVPIFLKYFLNFFFYMFLRLGDKKLLFFKFFISHAAIWNEMPKIFESKEIVFSTKI